jgi:hypothetical protein
MHALENINLAGFRVSLAEILPRYLCQNTSVEQSLKGLFDTYYFILFGINEMK